ncbi:RNA polymerase sigma factor [Paenibacillus sp. CAU 1782]
MKLWFEDLVLPHMTSLSRYCRSLTDSSWDAEDLQQEVLLRVYIYLNARSDQPPQYMSSFLKRAARNIWIDKHRRRRGRDYDLTEDDLTYLPYRELEYIHVRSIIETMAERLSSPQVELVLLADHYGYAVPDIAVMTGKSIPSIRSGLHRARHRLYSADRDDKKRAAGGRKHAAGELEHWSRLLLYSRPYRRFRPACSCATSRI